MKTLLSTVMGVAIIGVAASMAMANPALLPKHEGYPAKAATSPVTGQPLANDAGQTAGGGDKALTKSVSSTDNHVEQKLVDPNNNRVTDKSAGSGRLPKVQGPQIKIEPPVTSATKADASKGVK
jgi:hypothetical protein